MASTKESMRLQEFIFIGYNIAHSQVKHFHRPDRSFWWSSLSGYKQEITCSLTVIFSDFSYLISTHAIPLFSLYESGENNATVYARNLLIASGLLDYEEPINIGDSVKSAVTLMPATKPVANSRRDHEMLSVFPNPAKGYVIIEYRMPGSSSKAALIICNSSGIVVSEQILTKVRDQVVIETKSLSSGSYFVSLQVNGKQICSKPLSIIK